MRYMRLLLLIGTILLPLLHSSLQPGVTLLQKTCSNLVCAVGLWAAPAMAFTPDTTLQDQLKVLQALQVETQKSNKARSPQERMTAATGPAALVHGVISLVPPGGVDTTYPLGLAAARDLDPALGGDKATLILTAVGLEGPPLAARKLKLADLAFPLTFEITTADLLFPYNAQIWEQSKLSMCSIAVTAVLDDDGLLATPSAAARFGFALADPKPSPTYQSVTKRASDTLLDDGPVSATGLKKKDKSERNLPVYLRTEANIGVNFKSDGKPYSAEELDMLSRIDRDLAGRL